MPNQAAIDRGIELPDMEPPSYEEFVVARQKANAPSAEGESAYQLCRWYRGQMFYRATAQQALRRIREARQ